MSESASLPIWVDVLRVVVVFLFFLLSTALLIWGERRLVARMQDRIGPNRVGPLGIMQTLVDGIKMFFKEDVTPTAADKVIYGVAPLVGVIVGFLSIAIVPLTALPGMYPDDAGAVHIGEHVFGLQVADLNVGVLWFLAMGSIHVYSVFLAGWSSQSAYPLLGGVRSSAQMISYEIAQGLAVASVFVWAGSLRVSDIVTQQASQTLIADGVPNWFAIPLFPAFAIFVVGMIAEAGRPPFDLAEAEGELVAGFHTEYSGMRFGMFMLAEFMSVVIMSAIVVTIFFGGPAGPTFGAPVEIAWVFSLAWFTLKTFVFVYFFVLLRAALPRIRYDQLMELGWKVMIPVGLVWVAVTAAMSVARDDLSSTALTWIAVTGFVLAIIVFFVTPLFTGGRDEIAAEPKHMHPPNPDASTTEEVTA